MSEIESFFNRLNDNQRENWKRLIGAMRDSPVKRYNHHLFRVPDGPPSCTMSHAIVAGILTPKEIPTDYHVFVERNIGEIERIFGFGACEAVFNYKSAYHHALVKSLAKPRDPYYQSVDLQDAANCLEKFLNLGEAVQITEDYITVEFDDGNSNLRFPSVEVWEAMRKLNPDWFDTVARVTHTVTQTVTTSRTTTTTL